VPLPRCLEDFNDKCTLTDEEKAFVLTVGDIMRERADNLRRFQKWIEERGLEPDWAAGSSASTLKNRLYSRLGSSAKLPEWEIVEWIIATCLPEGVDRDDTEQELATRYKELTGRHPAGYITRPLIGERPLTLEDVSDDRTKARLLDRMVRDKDALLARLQRELNHVNRELTFLEEERAAQAVLAVPDRLGSGTWPWQPDPEIVQLRDKTARLEAMVESLQQVQENLRHRSKDRILATEHASTKAANHLAVLAAWLDALGIVQADFTECVTLLNVDDIPEARVPRILDAPLRPNHRAVTRWVTVHLRAFLLTRYGRDIDTHLDDSTGQLAALIETCALPSMKAIKPLLNAHEVLRRFIPRLLSEAEAECLDHAEQRSGAADTTVMEAVTTSSLAETDIEFAGDPAVALTGTTRWRDERRVPEDGEIARDEVAVARERRERQAERREQEMPTLVFKTPWMVEDMTTPAGVEELITRLRALDERSA
jgi:hypothetical protein